MAHIQINGDLYGPGIAQLVVNGVDYSREVFSNVELVPVGDESYAQVGLRVTFAVSRLDLDTEADVKITDRLPEVAQRVRSIVGKAVDQ